MVCVVGEACFVIACRPVGRLPLALCWWLEGNKCYLIKVPLN